ncbi:MAG: hypothetical protein V7606_1298 [Burkholderiales bacterium]|jgi:hypothetical protein
MAGVDVDVHIPKFGAPDFSLTARQLGQNSRPSGHGSASSDVWELVRLVNGKVALDPQDVAQVGKCNFVKDLSVRVDFGLEYFVAKELQDNITNAAQAGDKGQANFHRSLLLKIKSHAQQHYEQFVDVITTWEGDIKADLLKTLPTDKKPTSLQELQIKQGIGTLVADWMVELEFRLTRRAYDWEKLDYPHIAAQMKADPRASVFMPMGFSFPPVPTKPAARRKIIFPACRP